MYTLAFCLSLISIYCLYALSDRVEMEKKGIMLYLNTRKTLTLLLAVSAFLFSSIIFISRVGLGVGIFTNLSLWMVLACLTVLFLPFKVIRWPHLVAGTLIFLCIEIFLQPF